MADVSTAPKCEAPPFEQSIEKLEHDSEIQDQDNKKAQLASLKKLSDEVWQAEKNYAKDLERLKFAAASSKAFADNLKKLLQDEKKVQEYEQKKIEEIVACAPTVEKLEKDWKDARAALPALQSKVATAQNAFADEEERYKEALTRYQTNQKYLDDLQTQTTKEFEARNYRTAWFLLVYETKDRLNPPPEPSEFNTKLEQIAEKYGQAAETLRVAKVELEQKTADAQKKKKEFEDAKSKRRETILKQIAAAPFLPPPPPPPSSETTSSTESAAS